MIELATTSSDRQTKVDPLVIIHNNSFPCDKANFFITLSEDIVGGFIRRIPLKAMYDEMFQVHTKSTKLKGYCCNKDRD